MKGRILIFFFALALTPAGCKPRPPTEAEKTPPSKPEAASRLHVTRPENPVTLHLKNGRIVSGELLKETPRALTLAWEGMEVEFTKSEIARIERGRLAEMEDPLKGAEEKEWPHQNDVVILHRNQNKLDARIDAVRGDTLFLHYEMKGGGTVEQELKRSEIECLLFRPVRNKESGEIEKSLREKFPEMKFHRTGAFTILTDSPPTWVGNFQGTVKKLSTDFYLSYLPLLKGRGLHYQNFIVIFDDWFDYQRQATSDGVPGWAVPGYFVPDRRVLYLFNALGERFSNLLYEACVGRYARIIDRHADAAKRRLKGKEVFIDGQAKEIKDRFHRGHDVIRGYFSGQTQRLLRHEFTHELFHNYGLQSVHISQIERGSKEIMASKKRETEERRPSSVRRMLEELARNRMRSGEIPVTAANSWFVEGLATCSEGDRIGAQDPVYLHLFQKARAEGRLLPLEHLTTFRLGSFSGVVPEAQMYAYAQSWAFVHFLLNRHREGFLRYLHRMAREKPEEGEDLTWLLTEVGSDLRGMEREFLDYMDGLEKQDAPHLKVLDTLMTVLR